MKSQQREKCKNFSECALKLFDFIGPGAFICTFLLNSKFEVKFKKSIYHKVCSVWEEKVTAKSFFFREQLIRVTFQPNFRDKKRQNGVIFCE